MNKRKQMLILFPYTKKLEETVKKKNPESYPFRLNNKKSLNLIISSTAYKDMQPRLLKGIGKHREELTELFSELTEDFYTYFKETAPKTQEVFNAIHDSMCELVVKKINDIGFKQFKYGQAQKLINMSFKNFYCFDDAQDKEEYFKYCHIPIDSRILNEFQQDKYNSRFTIDNVWSKMKKQEYQSFQKAMLEYLCSDDNKRFRHNDKTSYTPLEVDFYIWAKNFCINDCNTWIQQLKPYTQFTNWNSFENTQELIDKLLEIQDISQSIIDSIQEK